jgi:hypothetical protein
MSACKKWEFICLMMIVIGMMSMREKEKDDNDEKKNLEPLSLAVETGRYLRSLFVCVYMRE